jgi:hypothetical protein
MKIDERSLSRMPDSGGKVQYALLKARRGNSTVPGESRTGHYPKQENMAKSGRAESAETETRRTVRLGT